MKDLELIAGAIEAIRELNKEGYAIIVVTSQSGIGRGYFTEQDYYKFNEHFLIHLKKAGAQVTAVYFCPHHPTESKKNNLKNCECRKPKTGMILQAEQEHSIDLSKSWVIGDKTSDIKMGEFAGCRSILVATGKGGTDNEYKINPIYIAKDLLDATKFILTYGNN